jgi:hypothetical protein
MSWIDDIIRRVRGGESEIERARAQFYQVIEAYRGQGMDAEEAATFAVGCYEDLNTPARVQRLIELWAERYLEATEASDG